MTTSSTINILQPAVDGYYNVEVVSLDNATAGEVVPATITVGDFVPVPEPGTLSLVSVGAASLLAFRRRK